MNPSSRQAFAAGSSAAGAAGLIAVLLMVAGNGWTATPSSFAESRGYQTCVDAADRDNQIVKVASDYFIYDHSDARRFYLNGYAFRDGASVPVKISCDTTLSGQRLLDVRVDAGQYAGRLVEPVDVARN
jgi:hypothetical protein